jgi:hypothetical protein
MADEDWCPPDLVGPRHRHVKSVTSPRQLEADLTFYAYFAKTKGI